jgi:hypothetical protein
MFGILNLWVIGIGLMYQVGCIMQGILKITLHYGGLSDFGAA